VSALQDGLVTVSPLPGSRDATPQTQISFLGVAASELSVQSVQGSKSGSHSGHLEPYSQGDGASFVPARPFVEGERVTVHATLRLGRARHALADTFAIGHQDPLSTTPRKPHQGSAAEVQSFQSRPDLSPPLVTVTADSPNSAPGDIFVAPYGGPGQAGPMILEPDGALVWFNPLPVGVSATNFQLQEYQGSPVLTWWEGDVSGHGFGLGNDVIVNSSYNRVGVVKAGNGLFADLHDFQLTDRDTALITSYDPIHCNLSAVGGPADGAVTDGVFQEIDIKTGLVRMQWTSLDHVGLAESYEHAQKSTLAWPFDFFHINSLSTAAAGSILVSGRNTWTVYDINGRTGLIQWRLGGRRSSFKEPPQALTAWQHDPRELPNGTLSVFDNGSAPTVHSQSRGLVLSLNHTTDTATLVSQFTHAPGLIAESQGDLQALANGDWFIGWGQLPNFSEVSPTGALLFDAHFPKYDESYRSFRFPWTGTPPHTPAIAFGAGPGGGTVYTSWNGATGVSEWRLLAGSAPASLEAVSVVPRNGFETAIPVPPSAPAPYLEVEAVGAAGQSLGVSPEIAQSG